MRIALARLLLSDAGQAATGRSSGGLLLLDEPTNHLDAAACKWLANFLRNSSGSVIIVSHDESLLEVRACLGLLGLLGRLPATLLTGAAVGAVAWGCCYLGLVSGTQVLSVSTTTARTYVCIPDPAPLPSPACKAVVACSSSAPSHSSTKSPLLLNPEP